MTQPLVSLIVATYKRDFALNKALISLLQQDYSNLEIILVSDNAEDEWNNKVNAIANNLKDNHPDIQMQLIINEQNVGSAETRNIGIRAANGDYKYGKKIIDYEFRSKDRWSKGHYLCKMIFTDNQVRYICSVNDPYMGCFLHAANYRENCYHCMYAQFPRIGDMTIGDFVGISRSYLPKGMFKRGMSVLLLNNEKSTKWFESICKKLWYTERPLDEAVATNKNLVRPCDRPQTRELLHEANILEDDIHYFMCLHSNCIFVYN